MPGRAGTGPTVPRARDEVSPTGPVVSGREPTVFAGSWAGENVALSCPWTPRGLFIGIVIGGTSKTPLEVDPEWSCWVMRGAAARRNLVGGGAQRSAQRGGGEGGVGG